MSLLARLIEAGTPAELIEEVAMMMAEKRVSERAVEEARAKARERQARKRERDLSRDVTQNNVTDCDEENSGLSLPPKELISNPPAHTPVYKSRARGKPDGKHRLPENWKPKPLTGDTADAVKGWPSGSIERELAKFKDWAAQASGPNAKKLDWDAAYRNWLRSTDDKGIYRKNETGNRNGRKSGSGDGLFDAAARELAAGDARRHAADALPDYSGT